MQERIAKLERELEGVRKVRSVQREGRRRHQWPVASVVGYTNAGKSTLLNLLTGAAVVVRAVLIDYTGMLMMSLYAARILFLTCKVASNPIDACCRASITLAISTVSPRS